ncbi:O-methyltransferase [Acidisoma sp. C75]
MSNQTDRLDPLSRAAIRHGSDKFGAHLYTSFYDRLFRHLRDKAINILEIGVGGYDTALAGGSSLWMWAEYFPYARIVGLDYAAKTINVSPRVTIIQGSQVDIPLLDRIVAEHGPFDIIIDDGSHNVQHVDQSFRALYPRLSARGIYVVEDTQTAFIEGAGGRPNGADTIFDLAHKIALAMHSREGFAGTGDPDLDYFGNMTEQVTVIRNAVAFHRGDNSYPSNLRFSLDHPASARIYQTIEDEAARNPAPRSSLSRIDMNIWAGRADAAERLALAAAKDFPDDIHLLSELARMMTWAGKTETSADLQRRLDALLAHRAARKE